MGGVVVAGCRRAVGHYSGSGRKDERRERRETHRETDEERHFEERRLSPQRRENQRSREAERAREDKRERDKPARERARRPTQRQDVQSREELASHRSLESAHSPPLTLALIAAPLLRGRDGQHREQTSHLSSPYSHPAPLLEPSTATRLRPFAYPFHDPQHDAT
ncbi:unnamed protein product [Boreogadus saida]